MRIRLQVLLFLSLLLSACSMEMQIYSALGDGQTLSGKLAGFSQISSMSSVSHNDVSVMSCSSPKVSLYKLDANGERAGAPLDSVSISSDGSYSFDLKKLGLKGNSASANPLMVVAKLPAGQWFLPQGDNHTKSSTVLSINRILPP